MCAAFSRASLRASSSPRALAISCSTALWLTLTLLTVSAQTAPSSSPPSISDLLTSLAANSTTLVQRLTERKAESLTLSSELKASQAESATLSDMLAQSQMDLTATSSSLAKSEAARLKLSADFEAFKNNSAQDLRAVETDRDAALTVARISGLSFKITLGVLALGGGYELGRALHFWK
jgi:septal ring factor EnvC (AmiA/AmiB activator)